MALASLSKAPVTTSGSTNQQPQIDPFPMPGAKTASTPSAGGSSPPPLAGGSGILSKAPTLNYDTNAPVYAAPELAYSKVGVDSNTVATTPEANYREQVQSIYQEDSPLVQAARTKVKEQFGGSGMLATDIAGRAAEGAAMDTSIQLAAPDVQYEQDRLRTEQGFQNTGALAEQAGGINLQQAQAAGNIQGALSGQSFGQQSALSGQQANQQSALTSQQAGHQSALTSQQAGHQSALAQQMNTYDVETRNAMQDFGVQNAQLAQDFQLELSNLGFSQDMEAGLLTTMQSMLSDGTSAMTSLAMSGEATPAEVSAIQEGIRNNLTTFSNIWRGSSGSTDTFDFSGIG